MFAKPNAIRVFAAAVASVVAGMTAMTARAQVTDLTSMTAQLNGQLSSLAQLAGMIAFLAGFVFGIIGFMKLRANAQNPIDPSNRVTTAFMLIFVGAGRIFAQPRLESCRLFRKVARMDVQGRLCC